MLITLDTELLITTQLTGHQFIILYLIKENEIDKLRKYLKAVDKLNQFIEHDVYKLIEMGFLLSFRKEAYDFNNLKITENFTKLICGGNMFQELVETYPKSVTRPDGNIDYLLTDLLKANSTYTKLTQNNKALHEHILHCLREEIEQKEETDTMKFMKRLPKWISERSWESYSEQVRDLQSVTGNSSLGYGERIE